MHLRRHKCAQARLGRLNQGGDRAVERVYGWCRHNRLNDRTDRHPDAFSIRVRERTRTRADTIINCTTTRSKAIRRPERRKCMDLPYCEEGTQRSPVQENGYHTCTTRSLWLTDLLPAFPTGECSFVSSVLLPSRDVGRGNGTEVKHEDVCLSVQHNLWRRFASR